MSTFTINIPAFEISGSSNGENWKFQIETAAWGEETINALVQQGALIMMQRSTAGMKDNTREEREVKRRQIADKIISGKLDTRASSTQFTTDQMLVKGYIELKGYKWPQIPGEGLTKSGKPKTKMAEWDDGFATYVKSVAKKNKKEYSKEFADKVFAMILEQVKKPVELEL